MFVYMCIYIKSFDKYTFFKCEWKRNLDKRLLAPLAPGKTSAHLTETLVSR